MTRKLQCRDYSAYSIWACATSALFVSITACDSGKSDATCPQGAEACPCYGNHTCNGSLTCASDLCVDLTGGDASATGGMGATGGAASTNTLDTLGGSTATSTEATGGNGPSGGALSAGGTTNTAADTSSSTLLGGAPPTGGSGNAGGVMSVGGSGNAGGLNTSGGMAGTSGGIANTGGEQSIGGAMATGGATTITTDPTLGGQPPVGGAANTGGTPATGGTATGGQGPATGGAPPTSCGNGVVEPWEGCDPAVRDFEFGDGCTPLCQVEPNCPPGGGPCTTRCGDGFVLGDEACDDGNTGAGDGCSPTCQLETGFDCAQGAAPATIALPLVVRDFAAGMDFEPTGTSFSGLHYATQGLVQSTLDANGSKPVLESTSGTYDGVSGQPSGIQNTGSFAQWYSDAASGPNSRGATLATELKVYRDETGAYANRWGSNGERWLKESYYADNWCGSVGLEALDAEGNPLPCTMCLYDEDLSTPECDPETYTTDCTDKPGMLRCEERSGAYYGIYLEGIFDGSPAFFPADGLTPASPYGEADLPPYYAGMWTPEPGEPRHNFSFTTEARFWFKYDASQLLRLTFVGDDDVWVFMNKKLVLDLGGIHTPVQGTLTVNIDGTATTTVSSTEGTAGSITASLATLGLEDGKLYEVAVFHAERKTTASTYLLSFSGLILAPSVCTRL